MFAFLFMLCVPGTNQCQEQMFERRTLAQCQQARRDVIKNHEGRREVWVSLCMPVNEE